MGELILRHDRWRAMLRPELGGALTRCDFEFAGRWVPVLRPAPADAADVLQAACFPMAPFCGRLRGGRFRFRGCEVVLPAPLHGFAWRRPWRVVAHAADRARIECDVPAAAWPWSFTTTQDIALDDAGLSIMLSVRNTGAEPMPCGIGLHPYFPCDAATTLSAPVTTRVLLDADVLPVGREPIAAGGALAGTRIRGAGLDDGFEGWSGAALIEQPTQGIDVRLTATASRLHVYAPAAQDYFCAEPVSHAIDAFNLAERDYAAAGVAVLAAGESTSIRLQLSTPPHARLRPGGGRR